MSKREINEIMEALIDLRAEFNLHRAEVEPLLELLRGAVIGRRIILFFTSTILAIIGAYVAITTLLK